ncbi:MAG: hypothetical protein QOG01_1243 [Pseudonocardiales bacterium]|jgi:hypothetical protein|nr:hypothetical protein [Pseudonocardiales bacterium]
MIYALGSLIRPGGNVFRGVLIGCALVLAGAASVAVGPSIAAASTRDVTRLGAGQSLIAGTSAYFIQSRDRRFAAKVSPFYMMLGEDELTQSSYAGATTWSVSDPNSPVRLRGDRTRLTMQGNGNLVLRTGGGTVFWQTHTAGTGTHNEFVVTNSGNMEVRTSAGKVVWMSHTTPVLLTAGKSFRTGQRWIYRGTVGSRWATSMTISSAGNFLLQDHGVATWTRGHSVKGSYVLMRPGGNLVLYTPSGNTLWQTHTGGHTGAWLELTSCGFQIDWRSNAGKYYTLYRAKASSRC